MKHVIEQMSIGEPVDWCNGGNKETRWHTETVDLLPLNKHRKKETQLRVSFPSGLTTLGRPLKTHGTVNIASFCETQPLPPNIHHPF